jgi:transcriptional pleiotropic regulator of transition state genes
MKSLTNEEEERRIYMKATGVVRKIDELGRIVIPIELRRVLNIEHKDSLEIFVEENQIILRKYESNKSCLVTGKQDASLNVYGREDLFLSEEGARKLYEEIKNALK